LSYAERGDLIRLISAREVTRAERKSYEENQLQAKHQRLEISISLESAIALLNPLKRSLKLKNFKIFI
jgi:hypothetical protein